MSRFMIVEEKHSTFYLDCETDELWASASIWLLSKRFREGYWYLEPDVQYSETSKPSEPEMPGAAIKALPEDSEIRKVAEKQLNAWTRWHAARAEYRAWYDALANLVEEQDTGFVTLGRGRHERQEPKAWRILDERSDYQYEGVTLETADRPWETV